jgi:hypothetical protein
MSAVQKRKLCFSNRFFPVEMILLHNAVHALYHSALWVKTLALRQRLARSVALVGNGYFEELHHLWRRLLLSEKKMKRAFSSLSLAAVGCL